MWSGLISEKRHILRGNFAFQYLGVYLDRQSRTVKKDRDDKYVLHVCLSQNFWLLSYPLSEIYIIWKGKVTP